MFLGLIGAAFFLLISGSCSSAVPQEAPAETRPAAGFLKVVPYVPTPMEVAERMLELAKVNRHDIVYDLGSGDGRIVIMAAQKFGAQAMGVELDDELFKKSAARIAELRLGNKAKIIHANMFETDLRPATVVTLYLLPDINEQIRPLLEKQLHSGARVVSHDFPMPNWKPTKAEKMTLENGVKYAIYLYVRP